MLSFVILMIASCPSSVKRGKKILANPRCQPQAAMGGHYAFPNAHAAYAHHPNVTALRPTPCRAPESARLPPPSAPRKRKAVIPQKLHKKPGAAARKNACGSPRLIPRDRHESAGIDSLALRRLSGDRLRTAAAAG